MLIVLPLPLMHVAVFAAWTVARPPATPAATRASADTAVTLSHQAQPRLHVIAVNLLCTSTKGDPPARSCREEVGVSDNSVRSAAILTIGLEAVNSLFSSHFST